MKHCLNVRQTRALTAVCHPENPGAGKLVKLSFNKPWRIFDEKQAVFLIASPRRAGKEALADGFIPRHAWEFSA
ncbi:MAG: hypothetical protein ACYC5X_04820 [Syntrophales bacterium]